MLKSLLALPMFFAAASLSANVSMDSVEMHSHHVQASRTFASTSILFTPTADFISGFTLSATPVVSETHHNHGFTIDSAATITLPAPGDYLIDVSLVFNPDFLQAQLSDIWNGQAFLSLIDLSTGLQVAAISDFNGTALVHATGPIAIVPIYSNFGNKPLAAIAGTLSIKKLAGE